jgi:hypothetical protein
VVGWQEREREKGRDIEISVIGKGVFLEIDQNITFYWTFLHIL